jgi:hypothetical protein
MKKAPFNPFKDDWNPAEHASELEGFADKLAASSGASVEAKAARSRNSASTYSGTH